VCTKWCNVIGNVDRGVDAVELLCLFNFEGQEVRRLCRRKADLEVVL
jgi:hypothetical protein